MSEVINDGRVCLTLGGDHSIGIGTVHGALKARPNTSILWVDAHADINTPQTSASKNLHGMPVSFNLLEMSEYQMKFPGFDWHTPMYISAFYYYSFVIVQLSHCYCIGQDFGQKYRLYWVEGCRSL